MVITPKALNLFYLVIVLSCTACAIQNPDTGETKLVPIYVPDKKYDPYNKPGERNIVLQILRDFSGDSTDSKHPTISGKCRYKSSVTSPPRSSKPCTQTYLQVRSDGETDFKRVWVDDQGTFSIPISTRKVYRIKAVDEQNHLESKEFEIIGAKEVLIEIGL